MRVIKCPDELAIPIKMPEHFVVGMLEKCALKVHEAHIFYSAYDAGTKIVVDKSELTHATINQINLHYWAFHVTERYREHPGAHNFRGPGQWRSWVYDIYTGLFTYDDRHKWSETEKTLALGLLREVI